MIDIVPMAAYSQSGDSESRGGTGGKGENSATHVSLATTLTLKALVPLSPGDTVELQGYFRAADGYFAADHTTFWCSKVG
jgi:hypothetical protein